MGRRLYERTYIKTFEEVEDSDPDIVIGCETWLYPGMFVKEVIPNSYHCVARKYHRQNSHEMVITAVKDNIWWHTIIDKQRHTLCSSSISVSRE